MADPRKPDSQSMRKLPTAERVRELLHYNPETGEFRWRPRSCEDFGTREAHGMWSARFAGKPAGATCVDGYRHMRVDGRYYKAHRLAWVYMTGVEPKAYIDHLNGDKGDNRWANLREATKPENGWNCGKPPTNQSGVKGVHRHKGTGKWRAQIRCGSRRIHLGLFDNIEDAAAAYRAAAAKYHGTFTNHAT